MQTSRPFLIPVVALGFLCIAAAADPHPFKDGLLHGKVLDANGKPVANATVALESPAGKVLAWAHTDAKGNYDLAANPKDALNLKPSHCRGLLEQCMKAAGDATMAAARFVAGPIITPGAAVHEGAVAVASGTPGAAVAQGTAASLPTEASAPGQIGQAAGGAATDSAFTGTPKGVMPPAEQHGHATLVITAKGFKDTSIQDEPYWMDPATEDKKNPVGVEAWMETVKLAPTAGDKKPEIVPASVTLSDPDVQPTLIPAGEKVQIKAKLNSPDADLTGKIRLFARLASKDTVVELQPLANQKGLYSGEMTIDPKTPPGQTVLCIGAVRSEPVEVRLNPKKEDPLPVFVRQVDDMNGAKPYGYDPFVMASENRLDTKVTILAPKKS